jgi:hypothetical protein
MNADLLILGISSAIFPYFFIENPAPSTLRMAKLMPRACTIFSENNAYFGQR